MASISGFGSRRFSMRSIANVLAKLRSAGCLDRQADWGRADELAMLWLRMSSSLTALSIIFFELLSTIRHFHYCLGSGSRVSRWNIRQTGGLEKAVVFGSSYIASCNGLDLLDNSCSSGQVSRGNTHNGGHIADCSVECHP